MIKRTVSAFVLLMAMAALGIPFAQGQYATMDGSILTTNGLASTPSHGFYNATSTGMFLDSSNNLDFSVGGTKIGSFTGNGLNVTGAVTANTASAGAPAYNFNGESTTGMFYDSTNSALGFSYGGTEQAYLNGNGLSVMNTVSGSNGNGGNGIYGYSLNGMGVAGNSYCGYGVYGTSFEGAGVYGVGNEGPGIYGSGPWGVYGNGSNNGVGIYGLNSSSSGMAVEACQNSTGYAIYSTGGMNYFSGNVGIGQGSPAQALDIVGTLYLENSTTPTVAPGNGGYFYANNDAIYLEDGNGGTKTRLSSHCDPRTINPQAQCSFGNLANPLPFSFYHCNSLIGKGQCVDMAKAFWYLEKKMQEDLGTSAGQIVYNFNLPTSQCLTLAQWNQNVINDQMRQVMNQIQTMPWILVPVSPGGSIPAEAFEQDPETTTVMQTVTTTENVIDYQAMKLVQVQRTRVVPQQVPTGNTVNRLKANYKLENGAIYRQPTVDDINLNALAANYPQLPPWILERIQNSQGTQIGISELVNQIRATMAKAVHQSAPPGKKLALVQR